MVDASSPGPKSRIRNIITLKLASRDQYYPFSKASLCFYPHWHLSICAPPANKEHQSLEREYGGTL